MLSRWIEMLGGGRRSSASPVHRAGRTNLARRFSIIAETSQGSMSKVYRAVDNESGRTVCVKIQNREKNEAAASRAKGHAERPAEGEIAARFNHPHVVRTFEYGQTTSGEHYLVMEFVDGVSFQYLREARAIRTAKKVELLAQAAEGLAAVHAAGFIHHDINPKNFIISRNGQCKIFDFGLAVPNTPEFRRPGNRTGTIQYMAPELLKRESIDERIDVFAFGVLAFEFLTDKLPYDAPNNAALALQRINAEPLDPAVAKPKLSEELCSIIRQLTARRREDRWPTMETLAAALRSVPPKRTAPSATVAKPAPAVTPNVLPESPVDAVSDLEWWEPA